MEWGGWLSDEMALSAAGHDHLNGVECDGVDRGEKNAILWRRSREREEFH